MFNTFLHGFPRKLSVRGKIRWSLKARIAWRGFVIEDEQMNNLAEGRRTIELPLQDADTVDQG
jgi:hypothetical protein